MTLRQSISGALAEIRGLLTALSVVTAFVLFLISVEIGWPGQALLQTLRFHIGAMAVLLAIALIIVGGRLRGALIGFVAAASLFQGVNIFMPLQQPDPPALPARTELNLISFNILGSNPNGAAIADYLASTNADVVITLETGALARYLGTMEAVFPYRVGCQEGLGCDMAIFSRYPIEDQRTVTLQPINRTRLMTIRVNVDGQPLNIVGLHLTKPYFDDIHLYELPQATRVICQLEGPTILAGDFNSAPWSLAVADFAKRNGFHVSALPPPTWPVELGPLGVPIDNVLVRDGASITQIANLPDNFESNHRGLAAHIELRDEQPTPRPGC